VENKTNLKIKSLRSIHGGEFISTEFEEFCELHGIKRPFSATRTPKHNGMVEGKNQIVQDMGIIVLNEARLSSIFWREVIRTIVYILNKGRIRVNSNKTPYEIWKDRPTTIKNSKFLRESDK